MILRDLIAQLDDFPETDTIYVEQRVSVADQSAAIDEAHAIVATEEDDGLPPPGTAGLRYFLEVSTAKDAIHVWSSWRDGKAPTLDEKVAAVTYYAVNDAYLPLD